MRIVLISAAMLGAAVSPGVAQEERTLLPPDERTLMGPPFPLLGLRAEAQASCTMTFDIAADGDSENICGVCAIDAPQADAALLEALEEEFVESAAEFVEHARRYERASAPTLDQSLQLDFAFEEAGRPAPQSPAKITCSDN